MLQLLLLAVGAPAAASAKPPPHIALIVSDDLGWDDVGFRSHHQVKTPNIDKMASEGRVLNHYYVQDVCSPSRAAFQTGRYPLHNTVNDWLRNGPVGLPLNETLIPQKLAPANYISHAIGKWHLGYACWGYTPTFRGYSSFYGFYSGGQDYFQHGSKGDLDFHLEEGLECGENCTVPLFDARGHYSTTLFTSRAVEVVEKHPTDTPLFLYLAYQAVHAPREVPAAYADAYAGIIADKDRQQFAGMLACMDEGIGNVTAALESKTMLSNMFIIFTTDNGGPVPGTPGGDYVGSRNYPLRGGKHSIWEGGTRGTALIWAGEKTGLLPSNLVGQPVEALMHGVDWLPTICAIAAIKGCGETGMALDGIDQSAPLFANASGTRQFVLYGQHDDAPNEFTPYDDAIRDAAGWKLIQGWGGKPSDWSTPVNASGTAYYGASDLELLLDSGGTGVACTALNCFADGEFDMAAAVSVHPSTALNLPEGAMNCSATQPCCYPGGDLKGNSPVAGVTTAAACCAACAAKAAKGCVGWTFNTANHGSPRGECFLKASMAGKQKCTPDCLSGGALSPPGPPSPPSPPGPHPHPGPPPPPKNGVMLFNVMTDPGEHNEVSAANPAIVARLTAELNAMRATAVIFSDKLNCTKGGTKNTTQGSYAVPNCVPY